ncbi:phosphoribosyl-AMP cyclohydrolase [Phreatobacter sp.]|uniref:phosphoribosyl-AMP cyclohydrolase n=1 Tax=Phreatobacter sp. TaxID=1966341 RepID=UPI0022C31D01|nr:phosphoribosyl-AMP cyclohydrolase [Phreatobacter sp.]MCZ8314830.1 phosphoribosyl-AMP cyclohydrolase [Phreatobacter sp.]
MCAEPARASDAAPTKAEREEGDRLLPRFGADGLITAVTTDAATGDLLMVAHMNEDALRLTVETGEAHYWSRSRGAIWHKGDTSGQIQTIVEMRIDCDQDAVWLKVNVGGDGGSCHTGRRTCFYRAIPTGGPLETVRLVPRDAERLRAAF